MNEVRKVYLVTGHSRPIMIRLVIRSRCSCLLGTSTWNSLKIPKG